MKSVIFDVGGRTLIFLAVTNELLLTLKNGLSIVLLGFRSDLLSLPNGSHISQTHVSMVSVRTSLSKFVG